MNELEQALRQLTTAIDALQDVEGLLWSADRYEKDKVFTTAAEQIYGQALIELDHLCSAMDCQIRERFWDDRPEVVENYLRAVDNLGRRW